MKKSIVIRFGIAVVVLIVVIFGIASVNGYKALVVLQTSVDSHWSDVDKEYQHRAIVVSDLIRVLSADASLDKTILTDLAQAADKVNAIKFDPNHASADYARFQQYDEAQQALSKTLAPVLIATLKNPVVMKNKEVRTLQAEVIESEDRLATKQSRFDQIVEKYNATVHGFPTVLEATTLGFEPQPSFQGQGTTVAMQSGLP
jgi:LemA protein